MERVLQEIDDRILDVIKGYSSESNRASVNFDTLALEVFYFQFDFNPSFRRHCETIGTERSKVKTLDQIPSVSVNAFKDGTISSTVPESTDGFHFATSGTTTGVIGRIYRDPGFFNLREKAIWTAGKNEMFFRFFPKKVQIIFLDFPNRRHSPDFQPRFSVLHNIERFFGSVRSCSVDIQNADGPEAFVKTVVEAQDRNQELVIMGPSYRLSYLISVGKQHDLHLPAGSMVMDSGGLKNQSCRKSYSDYLRDLSATFDIERCNYINTYALSEVGSQFSDNVRLQDICKQCPPWAKVRVVKKADCGEIDCQPEEKGEVIVYDLLNRGSVLALRTHDLAVRTERGFRLIERGE